VIATLNLNGDYISDALAAQVGGIGIAPGANLSDSVACFEATHGTAPKYAGKDYVNPGSEILSAEMMLRHMGWKEAADLIDQLDGKVHCQQESHLRLRPPDGRRHPGQLLGLRAGHDRPHVSPAGPCAPTQATLFSGGGRHLNQSPRRCEKPALICPGFVPFHGPSVGDEAKPFALGIPLVLGGVWRNSAAYFPARQSGPTPL
jgi:hypothetical protein